VWIDERHSDAEPYLQSIAAVDTTVTDPPRLGAAPTPTSDHVPGSRPLRRPAATSPARSTPLAMLARSSGHCEIFTDDCRYAFDRVMSRRQRDAATESSCPSELFVTCAACADIVAGLEPRVATRLGYLVDDGRDPANVPFHWRRSRWVLFDPAGWLTEMGRDVQTA
jgi:hypothetical protein